MSKLSASTRVFKKSSQNGKLTTYLGKRDFIDHVDYTDSIDGITKIDPEYMAAVPGRKVIGTLSCTFRYGREDLDVLGLTFRRDLYSITQQIYPPPNASTERSYSISNPESTGAESTSATVVANITNSGTKSKQTIDILTISPSQQPNKLTTLQTRLKRKLGEHAYPLYFKVPQNCPCSVTLQPAPGDTGKPCGIDYELKTWILEPNGFESSINSDVNSPSENSPTNEGASKIDRLNDFLSMSYNNNEGKDDEKSKEKKLIEQSKSIQRASIVKLAIRKIQYAPEIRGPQPQAEAKQTFLFNDKLLNLEATLDKELYHHGEKIYVNVQITNNSPKKVRSIKITVRQFADICIYSNAAYKCTVASLEKEDQVGPSQTLCKVYEICPLLSFNKDKRGLALDGQLKAEDTNLASSTIVKRNSVKENMGIIVNYKVKVKAFIGGVVPGIGKDVSVELPFKLMHARPNKPHFKQKEPKKEEKEDDTVSIAKSVNLITFPSSDKLYNDTDDKEEQHENNNSTTKDEDPFENFARERHLQGQSGS